MIQPYHSNGKLLLTGEYLVLKGAEALALPLQLGQSLSAIPIHEPGRLEWKSNYQDSTFFKAVFSGKNMQLVESTDGEMASYLRHLMQKVVNRVPSLLQKNGYQIETTLDFPLEWGLGSSSTLISNLAQWLQIDPFALNREITHGSGYDIACSRSNQPLLYQISEEGVRYRQVDLSPPFKDHIYFVFTGKKQRTKQEVKKFLSKQHTHNHLFKSIRDINKRIIDSKHLGDFQRALAEHERIVSRVLDVPPIQEQRFSDFTGTIKSLGAWGGDFILAAWPGPRSELDDYFTFHGMEPIFTWDEMIKYKQYA